MSNAAITWNVQVNEDSGGSIAARVRNAAGAYITQAGISSIQARYRRLDKTGNTSTSSLTVASVVFDALQTDNFWKDIKGRAIDTLGYNFRWDFSASIFTEPEAEYGVTFVFTPASGAAFNVDVKVTTKPRMA